MTLLGFEKADGSYTSAEAEGGMTFDGSSIAQPLLCSENGTYYIDGTPDVQLTGVVYCECKQS